MARSRNQRRNEGQTVLECPICVDFYDNSKKVPMVFSCGHTFCKSCLHQLPLYSHQRRDFVDCTFCRTPQERSRIAKNYTVAETCELLKMRFSCKKCGKPVGSQSVCTPCADGHVHLSGNVMQQNLQKVHNFAALCADYTAVAENCGEMVSEMSQAMHRVAVLQKQNWIENIEIEERRLRNLRAWTWKTPWKFLLRKLFEHFLFHCSIFTLNHLLRKYRVFWFF